MRWLKSFKNYKESIVIDVQFTDLMESLNIWYDILLSSISAQEVNLFDTLKMDSKDYEAKGAGKLDLDFLCGDGDTDADDKFVDSLSSISLKKSGVQHTDDYETFLNKPCKFMFIYNIKSNELENPVYIMFQTWNETNDKWSEVKLYKINGNVNNFYNKLSSKTIEIEDGGENYIYSTSNSGNEWILKNVDKENDTYKRSFRKEELQKLIDDKTLKVNLV